MKFVLFALLCGLSSRAVARGWVCKDSVGRKTLSLLEIPKSEEAPYVLYINDPKICFAIGRTCPIAEVARGRGEFVVTESKDPKKTQEPILILRISASGGLLQTGNRFPTHIVPTGAPYNFRAGECAPYN